MSMEFSKPQSKEAKKSPLEAFRKKVWQGLLLGSSIALFQACAPTREEIDAMPSTSIEDINKNGKALSERLIKTQGYVEDFGEKTTLDSVMEIDSEGNSTFTLETKFIHNYNLRQDIDPKSTHVGMVTINDFPDRPSYPPKDKFEIVGTIRKHDGKYSIFIVEKFDLTTGVLEKK